MNVSVNVSFNKSKITTIIGSIVFLLLGVMAIVIPTITQSNTRDWIPTTATICRIEGSFSSSSHEVYVDYTFDGKGYNNVRLGSYDSNMYKGEVINIKVDPNHPEHISYNNSSFYTVFIIVGAVFIVIGVAIPCLYFIPSKIKKKKNPKYNSNKTDGQIESKFEPLKNETLNNSSDHNDEKK